MKRTLSILLIALNFSAFAQLQVSVLNITTNDLVYDANTNRIYVSIPSTNGANGNSIGVINPVTKTLENTVFVGSEPSVLAISDNGQYIYSGFTGTSTVRRFEVATQTAGLQFSLGSDSSLGSYYVEDIEVMPGSPTTIAISRRNVGFSPKHEGVVIYDNAIMRPTVTPDHTGSNRIEFTGQNTLVGYNNETTDYGIRRMAVNTGGVVISNVTQNVLSGFGVDFIYKNNVMYSTNGRVIDIAGAPFVSGQFANVDGPVAYDEYYNRVCFASKEFGGNLTFKRFNPNNFLVFDTLPLNQSSGTAKSLITCGNGCYAMSTTDNKVIIINDSTLGIAENVKTKITVYPNPANDFIAVDSDVEITKFKIFDLNGRAVNTGSPLNNRIDVNTLQRGIYLVQFTDVEGGTTIEKFVKS